MEQKSKVILGLKLNGKFYFTKEEKQKIINEYLSSNCSKREIWKKYTGREEEHGILLKWMRQLGYKIEKEKITFASKPVIMQKKENKEEKLFETLQLEKRIKELEKQLKDAEIKAIAFSTMVDIAEDEFKIDIRKKYNTKP